MEIEQRIFIGGTGRSGTSVVADIFDHHPQTYRIPWESKFIVEIDGLRDLCAVASDPSHGIARTQGVVGRLEKLLRELLTSRVPSNIDYFQFSYHLGQEIYDAAVNRFFARITDYEYWEVSIDHLTNETKEFLFRNVGLMPRAEIVQICRDLIDDMFGQAALTRGKRAWAEKTPENIFALQWLWELYPDATIVHVKRDPRGVMHSMRGKNWAPKNLEGACRSVRTLLDRWLALRAQFDLETLPYAEIALEELVDNPRQALAPFYLVSGLVPFTPPEGFFDPKPVHRWKSEMSAEDRAYVEEYFRDYFAPMGYSV